METLGKFGEHSRRLRSPCALQTSRVRPKLTHTKDEAILNLKMRKLLLQLLTAQITKCPDHFILLPKLDYKDDISSDK